MKHQTDGNDKYMKKVPPIFNQKVSSGKMYCDDKDMKKMTPIHKPMEKSGRMYSDDNCMKKLNEKNRNMENDYKMEHEEMNMREDYPMYNYMMKMCKLYEDGKDMKEDYPMYNYMMKMYYDDIRAKEDSAMCDCCQKNGKVYDNGNRSRMTLPAFQEPEGVLPPFEPPVGIDEPEGILPPFEPPVGPNEPEGILPPFEPPLIPGGDLFPPITNPSNNDRIQRNANRMLSSLEGYYNSLNDSYLFSQNQPYETRNEIRMLRNRAYDYYNDAVRIVAGIPRTYVASSNNARRSVPRNYIEALDQANVYGNNALKYIANLAFYNYDYATDVKLLSLYLKLNADLKIVKELLK